MVVLFAVAGLVLGAYWVGRCEGAERGMPWDDLFGDGTGKD